MELQEARKIIENGGNIDMTFRSVTRDGAAKATRRLRGFDTLDRPLVTFLGWQKSFIVFPHEVIELHEVL